MAPAWAPLVPALLLFGYFLTALLVFSIRCAIVGVPEDEEINRRSASPLIGRVLRHYLVWVLSPFERGLVQLRVSPNAITVASLTLAAGAGLALALGRFAAGGWLYLGAGILDMLDGRIARRTGRTTPSGAFFDSVVDRYAELLVFCGFAWYYRATAVLLLVLLAAIGSLMVSYARARGEGLGVDVKIGLMQRPERLFYLGIVTAVSPVIEATWPSSGRPLFLPVVLALAALGLSTNLTALRRIVHTLRALDVPARPKVKREIP